MGVDTWLDARIREFALKFANDVVRDFANQHEHLDATLFPFRLADDSCSGLEPFSLEPFMVDKDLVRCVAREWLRRGNFDGYFFACEAWMAAISPGEDPRAEGFLRASERPNRSTIIMASLRLKSGFHVSYLCRQSNLAGERYTLPFEQMETRDGRFGNLFEDD